MKKLFYFALALMAMTVSLGITTSCSSSDDDEEGDGNKTELGGKDDGNDEDESKLPEEAQKFVGVWDRKTPYSPNGTYIIYGSIGCSFFFEDGHYTNARYESNGAKYYVDNYSWLYDTKTKTLNVVGEDYIGGWENIEWEKDESNRDYWAGYDLNSNNENRFYPADYFHIEEYISYLIADSKWSDGSQYLNLTNSNGYGSPFNYTIFEEDDKYPNINGYSIRIDGTSLYNTGNNSSDYLALVIDNDNSYNSNNSCTADYVLKKFHYEGKKYHDFGIGNQLYPCYTVTSVAAGKVTLKNTAKFSKHQLVFTGDINATLTRVVEE